MRDKIDDFFDESSSYSNSPVLSKIISPHIELRLEGDQINIYIDGDYVESCMELKVIIPQSEIKNYDGINSIDELSEHISNSDLNNENYSISPEEKFWGHCSNIQAWVENDYNTRILHSNIAFPLLKKLTNIGDPLARNVFKEEIAVRFSSGSKITILFLLENEYLNYLDEFEKKDLIGSVLINFSKFNISEFNEFVDLYEGILLEVGNDTRRAFLMNNLNEILNFIVFQLSRLEFNNRNLYIFYESLNILMSSLVRHEKRFFDYGMANYKIKNYYRTVADVEFLKRQLYMHYRKNVFYTTTNFSYGFERYEIFRDLKNALFDNENLIISNITPNIINNLIVEIIPCSKKAGEFFSKNFSNISDWFEYKQNGINSLTDLDQNDFDFTDKIHLIYLILWNFLCQHPKQSEMRYIKQTNFYFEISKFYDTHNCDVKIDTNHIHQQELRHVSQYQELSPVLIVKNRNEEFYHEYRDEELHAIIKKLFFRNENLIVESIFWRKPKEVFEISTKFDTSNICRKIIQTIL